jgi:hypothetical protein
MKNGLFLTGHVLVADILLAFEPMVDAELLERLDTALEKRTDERISFDDCEHPVPLAALDDRLGFVGTAGIRQDLQRRNRRRARARRGGRVIIPDPLGVWWGLGPERRRPLARAVAREGAARHLRRRAWRLAAQRTRRRAHRRNGRGHGRERDPRPVRSGHEGGEVHFMLAFLTALYRHASTSRCI